MTAAEQASQPIGVFDSGIGGLTVIRALHHRLPQENLLYFGDTARVPYGPKSPVVVREYAAQDVDFLVAKGVKMIVVACNTVSAVALDVVQKRARVPVVGMILPGAQAAASATRNKRVGIIGTRATVESRAYEHALRQLDGAIEVVAEACPLFVPLAEEGWEDHRVTAVIAREYLFPLKQERIDTLVLGCTHYPVLRKAIDAAMEGSVSLIDSGEAAAMDVERILEEGGLRNRSSARPNVQWFVSDIPSRFADVGARFFGAALGRVQRATPW